jgi:predicted O-linked N-acetylglucosamine transferase (SPINDLY family)
MDLHALGRQAIALHQQGRLVEAEALYRQILDLDAGVFPALYLLGMLRLQQGDSGEAAQLIGRALAINPGDPAALLHYGLALLGQSRFAEAAASFDRLLATHPGEPAALMGRGAALRALGRDAAALADYESVLAVDPRNADAWAGRGLLLRNLRRTDEALESFNQAIALMPDFTEALQNRGDLQWSEQRDYDGAVADLEKALALEPQRGLLRGSLLHLKMFAGDWTHFEREAALVHGAVRAGQLVIHPFAYQALVESPADSQACSRLYGQGRYPAQPSQPLAARSAAKIRIGYVSGDFREQAVGLLMAGLYEQHDKDRFEIVAFNTGDAHNDDIRQRAVAAFDRFIDIAPLSDSAAADRIRREGIDILVTLNGYFGAEGLGIFVHRPAPVQVSYMGFPATLGLPYIDYILADRIVIPEDERRFYDEEVVWLPESYWVNDSRREIAGDVPSRADCGLPEGAFVFCNFNSSYKLTPQTFASWMRILRQVPGSVLWLLAGNNPHLADNLRREAGAAGVAAERLVFAPSVSSARHLARLQLAGLSLDNLPYNAHTTAADVLWAGVPIVTCRGTTWPGRVAASLLTAIGLPELICETLADAEALAVRLAQEPDSLRALKDKLAANRLTTQLFDTARFARHMEAAYAQMIARHRRGEAPAHFAVEAIG